MSVFVCVSGVCVCVCVCVCVRTCMCVYVCVHDYTRREKLIFPVENIYVYFNTNVVIFNINNHLFQV